MRLSSWFVVPDVMAVSTPRRCYGSWFGHFGCLGKVQETQAQKPHLAPAIRRFVGLISKAKITAAIRLMAATEPNSLGNGMDSKSPPALPASQLPMLAARN